MKFTTLNNLSEAWQNELPFAIYHLPGTNTISVVIQSEKNLKYVPFNKIDEINGFFVAPFRGEPINELICIKPDVYLEEQLTDIETGSFIQLFVKRTCEQEPPYAMDKNEYLERLTYLVERLKAGDLRKLVMSRVINVQLPENFNPGILLTKLIKTYPDAFVYLMVLPGIGIWLGATPEILLKVKADYAETMALAGTKPNDSTEWTTKEKKEQLIVVDYIDELLDRHGIINYEKEGPFSVFAGDMLHLKTAYKFPLVNLKGELGHLVAGLHPTPAVCGLPRNKAYELLRKVEKHEREFYAGFVGPWNLKGNSALFVNLRCAGLCGDVLSLFVGGGITAESKPAAEWEETVRKSKTLLSVLEKM